MMQGTMSFKKKFTYAGRLLSFFKNMPERHDAWMS